MWELYDDVSQLTNVLHDRSVHEGSNACVALNSRSVLRGALGLQECSRRCVPVVQECRRRRRVARATVVVLGQECPERRRGARRRQECHGPGSGGCLRAGVLRAPEGSSSSAGVPR